MEKVIYIHPGKSTFVVKDLEILQSKYNVSEFTFNPSAAKVINSAFRQFFFLLFHCKGAKLIVCQFAAYHTVLPIIFGKIYGIKVLIITGGTESVSFPSINYGNLRRQPLAWATRFSLKYCSHISPVHSSLMYSKYTYQSADYEVQGAKFHIKDLKTPYTEIPNAYDPEKWILPEKVLKDSKRFLTIAAGLNNPMRYKLKGIDLIVAIAPQFPACSFVVIGFSDINAFKNLPENVIFKKAVANADLVHEFALAQFYLQLSISEGFPNALAEAMLNACVPIGSDVASIPYIIDGCGFILKKRSALELELVLKQALASNYQALGAKAKQRIEENFTIERRKTELLNLCNKLISNP